MGRGVTDAEAGCALSLESSNGRRGDTVQRVTGRPVWLAAKPDPVYAVLHTPDEPRRPGIGALILPTFGWDNEASYRARRDWAVHMASRGVFAARFDLPGSEDSAGSPLTAGRFDSWVEAVVYATWWLREVSTAGRVTAVGIGLGALLAHEAILAGAPIDDLILWGTRATGRAYVRELRAFAAIATAEHGVDESEPRADGALGLGGHMMSVETAEAISEVDLTVPLPDGPSRRVLLIGRDALGVDAKLRGALEATGALVSVLESPGDYRRMTMTPEFGLSPVATIAAATDWVLQPAAAVPLPLAPVGDYVVPPTSAVAEFEHDGVRIRERLLEVETDDGYVVGILSEPVHGELTPVSLVTLNTGALRRTGPNRLFVEVARRAAATGACAMRFDLPGLGDSDGSMVKTFERNDDDDARELSVLARVLDQLGTPGDGGLFVATGLCIGGYFAMRAAAFDPRVVGVVAFNPASFIWGDTERRFQADWAMDLAGPEAFGDASASVEAVEPVSHAETVRAPSLKWLEREGRRILARSEFFRSVYYRDYIRRHARAVDEVGSHSQRVLLVFAGGDWSISFVRKRRLAAALRRWSALEIDQMLVGDHLLRPLQDQAAAIDRVVAELHEISRTFDGAAAERASQEKEADLSGGIRTD